jgi:hypothetical protein
MGEALSAVDETKGALQALDDGKTQDALAALERASGKLDIILARDPRLALAPMAVGAMTYDVYATPEAVKAASRQAQADLASGDVQDARMILAGLASETVISVTNIPLATYPEAIKQAAGLIDQGKTEEAKQSLQAALDTLVITHTVVPLPVVVSQQLLSEAETLAAKKDRTADENKRLSVLLDNAHQEIAMAEALGYSTRKDFDSFNKELASIEDIAAALQWLL